MYITPLMLLQVPFTQGAAPRRRGTDAPGAMLLAPLEHRRVQESGGARAVAAGERLDSVNCYRPDRDCGETISRRYARRSSCLL